MRASAIAPLPFEQQTAQKPVESGLVLYEERLKEVSSAPGRPRWYGSSGFGNLEAMTGEAEAMDEVGRVGYLTTTPYRKWSEEEMVEEVLYCGARDEGRSTPVACSRPRLPPLAPTPSPAPHVASSLPMPSCEERSDWVGRHLTPSPLQAMSTLETCRSSSCGASTAPAEARVLL